MGVYIRSYVVALLLLQCCMLTLQDPCLQLTPLPDLAPYVDPVPVMPRVSLQGTSSQRPLVIGAYKTTQKLHRDLPASTIYAFGRTADEAATPGPTLLAEKDVSAYVRWENHINDTNHIFTVDPTIPRAEPPRGGVPLVVHLHGGVTKPDSDGHPDAWITALGDTGPNYTRSTYHYSNAQPATMLWYHDHSYGYTRLSVPAGLAGVYLILSQEDDPSWLPSSLRENNDTSPSEFIHDLVIQGKQVFENGSINYPTIGFNPNAHPNWCIDYFGDAMAVNGKIWPYLNVTRGVHRLRLLNGGNSAFLVLSLSNNMSFIKIGTEGGYLNTPVAHTELRLGPAQRADVLVDFSSLQPGDLVTMSNTGNQTFPGGVSPKNTSVMQFRVGSENGPAVPDLPASLAPNQTLQEILLQTTGLNISDVDFNKIRSRQFTVTILTDTSGDLESLTVDKPKVFRDPPTEIVNVGADELWEFMDIARPGPTVVAHPIHIHLTNFVVLGQQNFDFNRWSANECFFNVSYPDPRSCFIEPPQLPDQNDYGWKDTAVIWPTSITRFYVPFRPRDRDNFPFDPTSSPGYVWHCHILEHEDNEMMRPLLFVNNSTT